jgi:hypothetical protein
VFAAAVALGALAYASAHIIVVDLGSDSMKVALVKPGLAFQVVNNFQSKRKVGGGVHGLEGPVCCAWQCAQRWWSLVRVGGSRELVGRRVARWPRPSVGKDTWL